MSDWYMVEKYKRCGKKKCKCAITPHGPYKYLRRYDKGLVEVYIGTQQINIEELQGMNKDEVKNHVGI